MKRIIRTHRLTPEEAANYKKIREQIAEELASLIGRHHERMACLDQVKDPLVQPKAARTVED